MSHQSAFTPTKDYHTVQVKGFTVRIHPNLESDKDARKAMLGMLEEKLGEIEKLVPKTAGERLRKTTIWLDKESKSCTAAAYHPSAEWLREHGFNPDMEKGVELGNARNVLDWTELNQPFMVLHELAHAYHHQVLGYDDQSILAAYHAAKDGGKYEDVEKKPSGRGRHYGLNNEMEFFAETTESFFGMNDFQPFRRDDLKRFDPQAFAMAERAWGIKAAD